MQKNELCTKTLEISLFQLSTLRRHNSRTKSCCNISNLLKKENPQLINKIAKNIKNKFKDKVKSTYSFVREYHSGKCGLPKLVNCLNKKDSMGHLDYLINIMCLLTSKNASRHKNTVTERAFFPKFAA